MQEMELYQRDIATLRKRVKRGKRRKMKEQGRREAKALEMREEEEEETLKEDLEARVDAQAGQVAEETKLPGTTDPAQESIKNQTGRGTSQKQSSMGVLEKMTRQDDIIAVHL